MTDFTDYILTALALVFVIEGLVYALFPDGVRKMMAMALMMETSKIRLMGIIGLGIGLGLILILKSFHAA